MKRTIITIKELQQIVGWEFSPEFSKDDNQLEVYYTDLKEIDPDDHLFMYILDGTLEGYENDDEIPLIYVDGEGYIPLSKDEYELAKRKEIF